jgi:hypothetical protein
MIRISKELAAIYSGRLAHDIESQVQKLCPNVIVIPKVRSALEESFARRRGRIHGSDGQEMWSKGEGDEKMGRCLSEKSADFFNQSHHSFMARSEIL